MRYDCIAILTESLSIVRRSRVKDLYIDMGEGLRETVKQPFPLAKVVD